MIDIKTISVTDQYGLNSLVIDFTVLDTSEDLALYRFDLYKANHQTQNYYLLQSNITDFTYRDFSVNLYDISIDYYYKVRITHIVSGESQLSTIYGEYKSARADVHALGIIEIHGIYLENIITNKMLLLKKKRTGQVCTCFDDIRRRSNPVKCLLCYGTKYRGGYYSAHTIGTNFLNPPTKVEQFAQSEVGEWEGTPLQLWTQNYPLIQVQDIIVDKEKNIRYIVTNCHPSYMNFYLIRQTFQIQRLPDSNVVYQVPLDLLPESPFISVWDTRNSENSDLLSVNLPFAIGYNYDCEVSWGDGSTPARIAYINTEDPNKPINKHTYAVPGIYNISITGQFGSLLFDNNEERKKILNIFKWGQYYKMGIAEDNSYYNYFSGCDNLNISASDSPDVTNMYDGSFLFKGLTSLINKISLNAPELVKTQEMFKDCTNFNGKVTILNSKINNAVSMFENCTSFDQDLRTIAFDYTGDFDTTNFVKNTKFSTANYDLLLIKFASDSVDYDGARILDASFTSYSLGPASEARELLISQGWQIFDGGFESHQSLWDTTKTGVSNIDQIKLPTVINGNYNCAIDWGDGSNLDIITTWNDPKLTHTYSAHGIYTIKIAGTFEGFNFSGAGDADKLLDITRWGPGFRLGTEEGLYFQGCHNLVDINFDSANFSGIVNGQYFFNACLSLTNIDLSGKVFPDMTEALGMFYTYASVEVDLSGTNFPELSNFSTAFSAYTKPVLDLSTTLMPKIELLNYLCHYSECVEIKLPPNLSTLLQMSSAFLSCTKLKIIDFTGIDLSSLQLMQYTFSNSTVLEVLDLSPLDLSNVISMLSLCNGCAELASISLPADLTNLQGLSNAFQNCLALTSLDWAGINMHSIQFMDNVFLGCSSLSEFYFPTSIAPQNLYGMFSGCASPISLPNLPTLNVSNVIYMNDFLKDTYIDTITYSNALEYWATLTLQADVVCNMGSSTYNTAGAVARQYIIDTYNWTFIDSGLDNMIQLRVQGQINGEWETAIGDGGAWTPFPFGFAFIIKSTGAITVDWGDGTVVTTPTAGDTFVHEYLDNNEYDVLITAVQPITLFTCDVYERDEDDVYIPDPNKRDGQGILTAVLTTTELETLYDEATETSLFMDCTFLTSVTLPISLLNVTDARHAFRWCDNLTTINNISSLSNVTNAFGLFGGCKFTSIDISALINVTDSGEVFNHCEELTSVDVSSFTEVISSDAMFNGCVGLESIIGLSSLGDTTDADIMFAGCTSLTSIDVSDFTEIIVAEGMFSYCSGLTELDVSNLTKITIAYALFAECSLLTTINAQGLGSEGTGITDCEYIVYNCNSLNSFDLTDAKFLSDDVVDVLYDSLPIVSSGTINMTGCNFIGDISIATNKGWTVI